MELELFSGEKTGRPGAPGLRTIGEVSVHDLPWTSGHGERHAHRRAHTSPLQHAFSRRDCTRREQRTWRNSPWWQQAVRWHGLAGQHAPMAAVAVCSDEVGSERGRGKVEAKMNTVWHSRGVGAPFYRSDHWGGGWSGRGADDRWVTTSIQWFWERRGTQEGEERRRRGTDSEEATGCRLGLMHGDESGEAHGRRQVMAATAGGSGSARLEMKGVGHRADLGCEGRNCTGPTRRKKRRKGNRAERDLGRNQIGLLKK
jgi:hypothetical protein